MQFANNFANKVVPFGAGGIAYNIRFLSKSKHSVPQASAVVSINNLMGFVAHCSLLFLVVLLGASSLQEAFSFNLTIPEIFVTIVLIMVFALILALIYSKKLRRKLTSVIKHIRLDLKQYLRKPKKIVGSYFGCVLITVSYVGALYASAHALGSVLTPLQMLVIFTVGVAAASVTPTPGGLGGVEAALVAALTSAGIETSQAIAITLLYRFATFWAPILPGFIFFQFTLRRGYV